jgi:hypothetical protein
MSGDLEARIEQTLADRAGGIGMVGFTADDILRAGRRARTKHRRIGILAAATCVAAVVAGSFSVANLDGRGQAPITPGITSTPPSATASPSPSTDPLPSYPPDLTPTTGVPAASVKLNYAIGSEITPWDGGAVTVALPPGYRIFEGVRVPGWVPTATPSVGDSSHLAVATGGRRTTAPSSATGTSPATAARSSWPATVRRPRRTACRRSR